MKRCPECKRDYYDDSLLYCLDNGAHLVEGPAGTSEPVTALLTGPPGDLSTRGLPPEHTAPFAVRNHDEMYGYV